MDVKTAAARLSGGKVVYLVPTLALVAQVTNDLRQTFPEVRETSADEMAQEDLASVSVMTPERCLTGSLFARPVDVSYTRARG